VQVRQFARAPGLSAALLLTIALGVGSSVSIHRFVLGLTRPKSLLASMDRVVSVYAQDRHREAGPLSYQDYQSLRSHSDGFEWLGAAGISPGTIALEGQSAVVSVAAVTPRLATELSLSLDQGSSSAAACGRPNFAPRPISTASTFASTALTFA